MIQLPFDIELMNGRGEPTVFHIRRATPDDVDYVMQLQDTIMDALPDKNIYSTYTREESLDALETEILPVDEVVGDDVRARGIVFIKIRVGVAVTSENLHRMAK